VTIHHAYCIAHNEWHVQSRYKFVVLFRKFLHMGAWGPLK
jgi:hypothetical protein